MRRRQTSPTFGGWNGKLNEADLSRLNLTWGMRKSSVFAIGGRSSMVEPQIVVLAVAGSSPVGHPILLHRLVFE